MRDIRAPQEAWQLWDTRDSTYPHPFGGVVVHAANIAAECAIKFGEDSQYTQGANEILQWTIEHSRQALRRWEIPTQDQDEEVAYEQTCIVENFHDQDARHLPVTLMWGKGSAPFDDDKRLLHAKGNELYYRPVPSSLYNWLGKLSNERLVNFLQWNYARTEQATKALQENRSDIEVMVHNNVLKLVDEGIVPESVLAAFEQGFDQTKELVAIDAFEAGRHNAAGIYYGDHMVLAVNKGFEPDEVTAFVKEEGRGRKILIHEYIHAAGFANNMDLRMLTNENEEPLTWLNEAVVEHLALAALHGEGEVVDPAARHDIGAYVSERELLYFLLNCGTVNIPFKDVAAAYFEPQTGNCAARKHLHEQLKDSYREAFPGMPAEKTVVDVIAEEYNAFSRIGQEEVLQRWGSKLCEIGGVGVLKGDELPSDRADVLIRTVPTA